MDHEVAVLERAADEDRRHADRTDGDENFLDRVDFLGDKEGNFALEKCIRVAAIAKVVDEEEHRFAHFNRVKERRLGIWSEPG